MMVLELEPLILKSVTRPHPAYLPRADEIGHSQGHVAISRSWLYLVKFSQLMLANC